MFIVHDSISLSVTPAARIYGPKLWHLRAYRYNEASDTLTLSFVWVPYGKACCPTGWRGESAPVLCQIGQPWRGRNLSIAIVLVIPFQCDAFFFPTLPVYGLTLPFVEKLSR